MLLFLAISFLLTGLPCFAANINVKIENAIKEFVVQSRPEWQDEDIRIIISGQEKFLKEFSFDKSVDFSVPESYKLSKITPKMVIPVVGEGDNNREKSACLWVRIEVYKSVVVAKNKVKKGAIIGKDDIEITKKEIALAPDKYFGSLSEVLGKVAKIAINKGTIVFETAVKYNPDIKKGSKVRIRSFGDGVMVEASGMALEDGLIGDTIRIRREGSGKPIDATVKNSGEAEVQ